MIVLHRIGTLVTEFADYMAKARTVTELSQLTDRQLDDIGLSRTQLNTTVKELWVNSDAPVTQVQQEPVVAKQKANTGLSDYLASLYSSRNRPGYMV